RSAGRNPLAAAVRCRRTECAPRRNTRWHRTRAVLRSDHAANGSEILRPDEQLWTARLGVRRRQGLPLRAASSADRATLAADPGSLAALMERDDTLRRAAR